MPLRVLNLGCGFFPLVNKRGYEYHNLDLLKLTRKQVGEATYIRHDMLKYPYPLPDATFDRVYLSHVIEHISEEDHPMLLQEVHRLLKADGEAKFIYPEFTTVAKYYLTNKLGDRDFWKMVIYGRSGKGGLDHHKALMDTPFFLDKLKLYGLVPIKAFTDKKEDYNTVVIAGKGKPTQTYEELVRREVMKGAQ